jgi:hypothetical protein
MAVSIGTLAGVRQRLTHATSRAQLYRYKQVAQKGSWLRVDVVQSSESLGWRNHPFSQDTSYTYLGIAVGTT